MKLDARAALVIVDVQCGFDLPCWGTRNNPGAEANIAKLLKSWRETRRPVFHIQHMSLEKGSPLRPDHPGNAIKPEAAPMRGEPVIEKCVNSSFIGTPLEKRLRKARVRQVVLVGFTTNHCVSTTARMAGNLGFDTIVVSDATATFARKGPDGRVFPAKLMHAVGLAELHREFATIAKTREVLRSA